ncbi:MAG: hypothetical protein SOW10_03365, partial [Alloprevotella sp.]|nr:hypothetical protein [Alloprevotella sp.]
SRRESVSQGLWEFYPRRQGRFSPSSKARRTTLIAGGERAKSFSMRKKSFSISQNLTPAGHLMIK